MVLAEVILRRALLPNLVIDAWAVKVIDRGGISILITHHASAIVQISSAF